MDNYFWISGFAVIILKYLLHGRLPLINCWNNRENPGVYNTHYSVRVVFSPSRVRVGQKIPSLSQVSSTRRALFFGRPALRLRNGEKKSPGFCNYWWKSLPRNRKAWWRDYWGKVRTYEGRSLITSLLWFLLLLHSLFSSSKLQDISCFQSNLCNLSKSAGTPSPKKTLSKCLH